MNELKKLIWAVDVLADTEPQKQVLALLRTLAAKNPVLIEPVFLLSPAQARVSPVYVPKWDEAFRALAEKKLAELVRVTESPSLQLGTVLVEPDSSTRKSAFRLIQYAKDKGADAIVVSTHARKGLGRFFLGSFAETLLLQSTVPVLTVSPNTQAPKTLSNILFPTDFGQPSRRGFEATVDLAKTFGAKITLFYKEPPIVVMPDGGTFALDYNYVEREAKARKSAGGAWVEWAKGKGVDTRLEIDDRPGDVATAITEYASTTEVDLISMIAESGPVSSVLLGSVTRKVVRIASTPVWVRHS